MFLTDSVSLLLALTLITLLVLWLWTKSRRSYSKFNIPPFPVPPLPFLGHFHLMRGNLMDKIKIWRQQAGDIYCLDIAGKLQIVLNDYDVIKEIFVKHADYIINVQKSFENEILEEYDKGIFGARDDNWKEQRRTSMSILRSFGMGKNIMANKIKEEVTYITEKLAALKGQPEDVRTLLNISVSNVICSVSIGKRFDYKDPEFVNLIENLRDMIKYGRDVAILTPLKFLSYLPGDLFNAKKWARSTLSINEMFSKAYVQELKKDYSDNEEPENFITAYIQEMKKLQKKGAKTNLSEANLIAIIRTLFLAGTETTSTTILWCLLYMLHNPKVQEKVYREIEEHVGTERQPNIADKPKLKYLNAVIMETQRLASLAPIGLHREVSATFEVRGFTFPKDSILWPVLDSVLHDQKIWGDPENFRPERFIDKNGALVQREELIPFSIGRRVCMGESLARMELFLFLSAMFQRFRFEPENKSDELPTLKPSYGSAVTPFSFKMTFLDRKKRLEFTEGNISRSCFDKKKEHR